MAEKQAQRKVPVQGVEAGDDKRNIGESRRRKIEPEWITKNKAEYIKNARPAKVPVQGTTAGDDKRNIGESRRRKVEPEWVTKNKAKYLESSNKAKADAKIKALAQRRRAGQI